MRKFNITVDGKKYEVEVDEILSENSNINTVQQQVAQPIIQEPAKPITTGEGEAIKAPMPGVVLSIICDNKQIKKGEPILMLEAMKMENNIAATKDGFVTVTVAKGANVNTGDILAYIK